MNIQKTSNSGICLVTEASELFEERILVIYDEIGAETAVSFTARFLTLLKRDKDKPITVLIHSGGGQVDSGIVICDLIRMSPAPITTVCLGKAYSMAALILACGGRRKILPHGRVMIHQPSMQAGMMNTSDFDRANKEIILQNNIICGILSEYTGKTEAEIKEAIQTDYYMSAKEAVSFGIADEIISLERGTI